MDEEPHTHHVDKKLRKRLLDFIRATVTLKQAAALYGRGNVTFKEAEERWNEAAEKAFELGEAIEITVAGKNLFFGDVLIESESTFVRDLIEILRSLIIRRLIFTRGLRQDELYALIEMLSFDTKALLLEGGPATYLADREVKNIQVIENIYMKRMGMLGKIDLDRDEVSEDDLRFVSKQLKNFITLRKEGLQLRRQEGALLAGLGQHPTFMGELVREISGGGDEEINATELHARAEDISETLEVLFGELVKDPAYGEKFATQAFSGALKELEEPLRLEVLAEQFRGFGQLPPVLGDEVFECSAKGMGEFILNEFQRGSSGLVVLAPLLKRLITDERQWGKVGVFLKAGCAERGLDQVEVADLLRKIISRFPAAAAPEASPSPEEAGRIIDDCLERIRGLGRISVDRAEVASYMTSVEASEEAVVVLAEILSAGGATAALAEKAGGRVEELVKKELFGNAVLLLDGLIKAARAEKEELSHAAARQLRELWDKDVVRAVLVSPLPGPSRAGLIVKLVEVIPRKDVARFWERMLRDKDRRIHALIMEAGSSAGEAVAAIVKAQIEGGDPELLSRSASLLGALPAEIATPILEELCQHPQSDVRLRAISVLGKAGGEKEIPLLEVMARDKNGEVRRTAISLLGHVAGKAALGTLLEIVGNSGGEWETAERALACRAVAKCGDERAVPVLEKVLRERGRGARGKELESLHASVRFALESIGGAAAELVLRRREKRRGWNLWRLFGRG